MLKKRKINFIINLSFSIYLFGYFIYILISKILYGDLGKEISDLTFTNNSERIFVIAMVIIICILYTIFNNIIIILLFVGIKLGTKSALKDKLTDEDFGKNKKYYRDIIENYSPALLSFIDDFKVDEDRDVVATLLSLKLKKYIDIKGQDIILLDNNQDSLDENERYLLNNINNIDTQKFSNLIIKDAVEKGLVETQDDIKRKIKKKIIQLIIGFILLFALPYCLPKEIYVGNNVYVSILIFILFIPIIFLGVFYPVFSVIYLISYIISHKLFPYIRSKKGQQINESLEGLKNYIKDFSIMNQRHNEELILWEDYLIYSVIFNQNKIVVQEYKQLITSKSGK